MNMPVYDSKSYWEQRRLVRDEAERRLQRITGALARAAVPYALVGGQAVAIWMRTKASTAQHTNGRLDLLLRRKDLQRVQAAAATEQFQYFPHLEIVGAGTLLDATHPNPRNAVTLLWAGEKVRPHHVLPAPQIEERLPLEPDKQVVSLAGLVRMKLNAFRDQDRLHLRDMIDIGLVGREQMAGLPAELAGRFDALLTEMGR